MNTNEAVSRLLNEQEEELPIDWGEEEVPR
jgi:hypothetical protein